MSKRVPLTTQNVKVGMKIEVVQGFREHRPGDILTLSRYDGGDFIAIKEEQDQSPGWCLNRFIIANTLKVRRK